MILRLDIYSLLLLLVVLLQYFRMDFSPNQWQYTRVENNQLKGRTSACHRLGLYTKFITWVLFNEFNRQQKSEAFFARYEKRYNDLNERHTRYDISFAKHNVQQQASPPGERLSASHPA